VLRKEPMSKEVEEGDSFSFNEAFSSKLYKIKIGTVSAQKEGEVEKQETRHKVRQGQAHSMLGCWAALWQFVLCSTCNQQSLQAFCEAQLRWSLFSWCDINR
jgi:hypothetical protein